MAGLDFLDEADTVNRLVPRLQRMGIHAIVLLLHQGGFQNAPFSQGFLDVNGCDNFTGPELLDVVNRLDPEVDVVLSAHTHQPYICEFNGKLVTSASSFGRLITEVQLTIDRKKNDIVDSAAENHVVTQTVEKDPAITAILDHYRQFSDPIGNRVVGSITEDIRSSRDTPSGQNAAGEQPMGDVIADAQLEATEPTDFGGSSIAFMNPGGVRGGLLYDQISGGEQPGEVTYAELFTVQPFGNSLVVKDCTGQQVYDLLEQQFDNPAAGSNRILLISAGFTYQYRSSTVPHVQDGTALLDGTPIDRAATYRVTMNIVPRRRRGRLQRLQGVREPARRRGRPRRTRALLREPLAGVTAAARPDRPARLTARTGSIAEGPRQRAFRLYVAILTGSAWPTTR